jgi:hypothetical protein
LGAPPWGDAPECFCVSTALRLPISTLTGLYRSRPAREGDRGDRVLSGAPASPPRSSDAINGDASGCVASCAMVALATLAGKYSKDAAARTPATQH